MNPAIIALAAAAGASLASKRRQGSRSLSRDQRDALLEMLRSDSVDQIEQALELVASFGGSFEQVVGERLFIDGSDGKDHYELSLNGIRFPKLDLRRSTLVSISIERGDIGKPDMRGSHFDGFNIYDSEASGWRASGSSFTDCHITGANFPRADLSESTFDGCHIEDVILRDAKMRGVKLQSKWNNGRTQIRDSDLSGVDLSPAGGPSIIDVYAYESRFDGAKMGQARLNGAFAHCSFVGSNLAGAGMAGFMDVTTYMQCDFTGADMQSVNLKKVNLGAPIYGYDGRAPDPDRACDLSDANLRGADLRYAKLCGCRLDGTDLRDAKLEGADLRGTDLSQARLNRNMSFAGTRRDDNTRLPGWVNRKTMKGL